MSITNVEALAVLFVSNGNLVLSQSRGYIFRTGYCTGDVAVCQYSQVAS